MTRIWVRTAGLALFFIFSSDIGLRAETATSAPVPKVPMEKPIATIAAGVYTADHLRDRCEAGGGVSPSLQRGLSTWETENQVEALRSGLITMHGNAENAAWLDKLRLDLIHKFDATQYDPCAMLKSWLSNPDSHFVQNYPDLVDRIAEGSLKPSAPRSAAEVAAEQKEIVANDAKLEQLAHDILGHGFVSSMVYGYGGMMTYVFNPILLFKNGDVVTDVSAIGYPGGIEAHKSRYPGVWGAWRKTGGHYEYRTGKGAWQHFDSDAVDLAPTSDDIRLDGHFQHFGGGGTAVGGTSIATWADFIFHPDGTFETGGGVNASTETSNGSGTSRLVASSRRGPRQGHYKLEGLLLKVTFDDGAQRAFCLIGGTGKVTTVWINGVSYTR